MIRTHNSANRFLSVSLPLLQKKEAENMLLIGIAANLSRDTHYYSEQDPLFITIHHGHNCVGACLQTPPKNLILYTDDKYKDYSISELCRYLQNQHMSIPGIDPHFYF